MTNYQIKRRRGGFTLVEMLVAITMITAMLSLTGMTFFLLMRSEKLVTQSLLTERTIARLAVQFRDDVHQSKTGEVISAAPDLVNELLLKDDQKTRVRYRVAKDGVVRLLVDGESTVAREDFRLPDCHVKLSAGVEADSMSRTLTIERPMATITRHSHASKPLRSLKIDAQLNRQQPAIRRNQPAVRVPTGEGLTEGSK